ncbi:ketoacyl reductase [Edaphobacter acidisoli]|uniref:Ketoacyl reductase n=1 Tax=Edaphobacter acidisoli TaxID=2040573 RepID=A0A916RX18_9BACT|nr:SDR family oxidoreductase [Edaphobacter acidisoli]GGA74914.1 ketoacyl reductase [Edaphobacter acidisoli]
MKKSTVVLGSAAVITGAAGIAAVVAVRALFSRRPRRTRLGQIVVITGGSRGLGLALAERFGRAGAKLVLAARNHDELARARQTLLERNAIQSSEDIQIVSCDLTDAAQATTLIEHAVEHFGRIDILINNAGIIEVGPVEDQPLAAYRRAMATNFFAALYTTHAALPHMLNSNRDEGDAAIVNISSIGGKIAVPHMLPYTASKFALTGFSEGLHAELRHKGIRVTTVCPGLMRTGGESNAHFIGQSKKEKRWFVLAAKTPVIAASVNYAANRIYDAVAAGRTEITITPQAWLAARAAAIAPGATQYITSLANHFLLPNPSPTDPPAIDFTLRVSTPSRDENLNPQLS